MTDEIDFSLSSPEKGVSICDDK